MITSIVLTFMLTFSPSTSGAAFSAGTDPTSALCKVDFAARNEGVAAKRQALATKAQKAINAGNWPAAKKDLLSGLHAQSGGYLIPQWRTAPRKEQAELAVLTKFLTSFANLTQRATSIRAYAASLPSLNFKAALAAENELAQYEIGLCGVYPGAKGQG